MNAAVALAPAPRAVDGIDVEAPASSVLRRTFDPTQLNEIVNHPDVSPWVGIEGKVDLTPVVENPANYTLMAEGGGFLLVAQGEGIYEVHSQFLPEARRGSIRAMREGFDYMFTRTDCVKVQTQVPDNNEAAAAFAKLAHFRPMFRREDAPRGPTEYVGITVDEWAQGCSELEKDGRWFHEQLETAKKAAGSELPTHPDDPAHERAVGAAVRMIKRGRVEKGVALYNRWALFAGYAPIGLLSETVIDVVDAIVEARDMEMEILLCR